MADIGQLIEWMTSGLMLSKERVMKPYKKTIYSLIPYFTPASISWFTNSFFHRWSISRSSTSTFFRMAIIGMFFQDGLTGRDLSCWYAT